MKKLLWKLLRKHLSVPQLVGFALANLIGLAIVILAVQFYQDVKPVFNDEESFISKDYLIVSKSISTSGALMGGTSEFSDDEIADIEAQKWCRSVGRFTSGDYSIVAMVSVDADAGRSMYTQLFFEAIPTQYIDVDNAQWKFDPANPQVPVIISRDYLSLYNFGFASTQGLPQISEGMASSVPLRFRLTGNGHQDYYDGRIVGFSNRLNTILVPYEFMQWSNERYGSGQTIPPSRLVVEVNRPGDVVIDKYMEEHGYEIAGDKGSSNKAYFFLTIIISIVIVVGILISLLSFFVLMLSIYLLLQKNTKKLQDLLLLGYSPAQVSRTYINTVIAINAGVLVVAIILMLAARAYYLPMLQAMGTDGGSLWAALAVALVIMAAITAGNIYAIKRKVMSLWHQ